MSVLLKQWVTGIAGGQSWSSYWATRNAYFALPATGVSLMVGQEVTIYGDSLISVPIGNPLSVTYTCDIGTQTGNNLVVTPIAGDIGDHTLRAVFRNGGYIIEDKTITLSVLDEAPVGTKSILMIGDSLTSGGCGYFDTVVDAALSGCTLTFVGTLGTTTKHEGRAGYWWQYYATDNANPSPFIKAGVLDIASYFADNSIATPDYVFIRLGVNDIFGQSNPAGDKLTDAEITTILGYAETLIDGFLAFNAAIKIVVGLITTSDNDGVAWDAAYDTEDFNQDFNIENAQKFNLALTTAFANGTYNARVDVGYDYIFMDRGNYASGVHPDATGYAQLGAGMAFKINEFLKADLKPTGVTAVWENNYAKIDFTDATGGVAQHEIWESRDGGAYSLVTTLDAGTVTYNNLTWQNSSMNFIVRAKSGTWFSDYTTAVNLVTPLVLLTNQATLGNIVITNLTVAAGKTVNIAWGDGTNNNYTGTNLNITKTYSVEANPYYIVISGDVNSINALTVSAQTKIIGSLNKWKLPAGLTSLSFNGTTITWDISNTIFPSNITTLNLGAAGITGNIATVTLPAALVTPTLTSSNITGDLSAIAWPVGVTNWGLVSDAQSLSGDLSGKSLANGCTRFYAANQNFTGLPRGIFKDLDAAIGMYAAGNNCATAEIDAFLAAVDAYFTTVTPIKNSNYKLDGVGMGIPSAAGLASRTSIQGKFTAAGFTATITVNS